jgi:4-diphosphocytidyl-2-C-methyl-D-erythritol kinase
MSRNVRVRAAAKVNLHLRVYNRRGDGFHDILSLFQAVSLADTLVIRSLKESDIIEIEGDFDCPARDTTVYRAVEAFRCATGLRTGLRVAVDKRIPPGGGLGGGSSDAAAVLLGLASLLGGGLSVSEIEGLGAAIGSDVPFFLSSAAAIVSGRGEKVEPLDARDDFSIVIAFPGFPVATAGAYALLDRERPDGSGEADPGKAELVEAYRGEIRRWPFFNSFEAVVGAQRPEILAAKGIMSRAGASFTAMSGSGSSIFGIFEGGKEKEMAIGLLRSSGFGACAVSPLARCMSLD